MILLIYTPLLRQSYSRFANNNQHHNMEYRLSKPLNKHRNNTQDDKTVLHLNHQIQRGTVLYIQLNGHFQEHNLL